MKTNFWTGYFKLGYQVIPRFLSAPMDGITDSPFRQMIRTYSSNNLLFTQMQHIFAILNGKPTQNDLAFQKIEQPLAFQIFANSTEKLDLAVAKILNKGIKHINLNAGCPSRKIVGSGCGSALMSTPTALEKILRSLYSLTKNKNITLTLKQRAGFKTVNGLEIAKIAENCGVDGIIIHPRLQTGKFSDPLNLKLVKKIKEKIKIPVIFSGNITNFQEALEVYKQTNVDGFMIGRALWGAPWKLKEIEEASQGNIFQITPKEKIKAALKHLNLSINYYGEETGLILFKKHLAKYLKQLPHATDYREKLLTEKNLNDMKEKLESLIQTLTNNQCPPLKK